MEPRRHKSTDRETVNQQYNKLFHPELDSPAACPEPYRQVKVEQQTNKQTNPDLRPRLWFLFSKSFLICPYDITSESEEKKISYFLKA